MCPFATEVSDYLSTNTRAIGGGFTRNRGEPNPRIRRAGAESPADRPHRGALIRAHVALLGGRGADGTLLTNKKRADSAKTRRLVRWWSASREDPLNTDVAPGTRGPHSVDYRSATRCTSGAAKSSIHWAG